MLLGKRKLCPKKLCQLKGSPHDIQSNFGPIGEGGCTACARASDTICGTYVICPAYLQSRCSPS